MAVSPTGIESGPLDVLRTTIATSTTFQSWVGATGDAAAKLAAAKARIYPVKASTYTLPCAVIDTASLDRTEIAVAQSVQEGTLLALFLDAVSESNDTDAAYAFLNKTGAIISEIMALVGTAGMLNVTSVRRTERPIRTNEDEAISRDDEMAAQYEFGYFGG